MDAENKQTMVFCATMKHVEYVVGIMNRAGIDNSFIYSQLDATARKLNIQRFTEKKSNILIVTDVAARGVDIPLLDTVINLHFPPKAKLFVHRVGRVARAGRSGTAISLISSDELPYLADLFLFLGKPMRFAHDDDKYEEETTLIGRAPEDIVGLESEFLNTIHDNNEDMIDLRQKATNAMMRYIRTRPPPSAESARRVKDELRLKVSESAAHPFLRLPGDTQRYSILNQLANYKTSATIFELNVGSKSHSAAVMKEKRRQHQEHIREMQEQQAKKKEELLDNQENDDVPATSTAEQADEAAISETFTEVVGRGGGTFKDKPSKKVDRAEQRRREKARHFVAYSSADYQSEKQLALEKVDFARQADGAAVEIFADDDKGLYKQKNAKRWDRKKKRFVGASGDGPDNKKIRTEDGTWLPASYKTGRYEDWKKKQKLGYKKNDEDGDDQEAGASSESAFGKHNKWKNHNKKQSKGPKSELRNISQIKKIRKKSARLQQYMEHRRQENLKKKAARSRGNKGVSGGKRK
ncbi:DBP10CT domain protein [Oesophagostomum dentatum]|uniref:RNA helicase n=1 Tax=Oesophagostomum dentatum TaxID=61180 RepID=A0A0B1T2D7_OESDE|nr:DBP10CT domain protein [Oesophagostomum dentatum]